MSRILLVEDEPGLVESLTFSLQQEGFSVESVDHGREALSRVEREPPDLILLDVMLKGSDGKEVCRELRARRYQRPILMLTAMDRELDKVVGLEVGADDYITKPFSTAELVARVRAHLRRCHRMQQQIPPGELSLGEVTLKLQSRELFVRGKPAALSPGEFDLLSYLMENHNHTVSRRELLEKVWGYECGGDPSIVNVAVQRLRSKLKPLNPIETVRGVGYLYRACL